jgi:hypothetical protein
MLKILNFLIFLGFLVGSRSVSEQTVQLGTDPQKNADVSSWQYLIIVSVVQYIGEPVEKNVLSWKQLMAVGEEAGPESRMATKFARNFDEMFTEISQNFT